VLPWPALFVTFTVTVQEAAPAGTSRELTDTVPPPAVAVVAAMALVHVPPTDGGLATINPDGSVSANPTMDDAGLPAGLASVKVKTVVSPSLIIAGENAFERIGTSTVTQLAVMFLRTLLDETFDASFVNAIGDETQLALNWPSAFVTGTVTVQLAAPAGTIRFVTVIVPPPALALVAAAALTQVPPTVAGVPTISPLGRVSEKLTLLSSGAPDGFVRVKVSVVVPAAPMIDGENALESEGNRMLEPARAAGASARHARASALARSAILRRRRARPEFVDIMLDLFPKSYPAAGRPPSIVGARPDQFAALSVYSKS
jgi:hypothetical protein